MAAWVGAGALALGIIVGGMAVHVPTVQAAAVQTCGSATPQHRTTLYFGGARPKGSVSELDWQLFVRDEVTSRFPNGMTSDSSGPEVCAFTPVAPFSEN